MWAKAFADSEGDENKCKALYLRLRVQHEKDRLQQEHHSAHLAAVEATQRKPRAFQYVIDNLSSLGYKAKMTTSGWTIREPLGGRVKLNSDQALLDYAQGRIKIPSELSSEQDTGNQLVAMEAINSSNEVSTSKRNAVAESTHKAFGSTNKAMPSEPHQMDGTAASSLKSATKLRLFGGLVLLFNLWLIGQYNLQGVPVLLLTFGFAAGYEFLVVRPVSKSGEKSDRP